MCRNIGYCIPKILGTNSTLLHHVYCFTFSSHHQLHHLKRLLYFSTLLFRQKTDTISVLIIVKMLVCPYQLQMILFYFIYIICFHEHFNHMSANT